MTELSRNDRTISKRSMRYTYEQVYIAQIQKWAIKHVYELQLLFLIQSITLLIKTDVHDVTLIFFFPL